MNINVGIVVIVVVVGELLYKKLISFIVFLIATGIPILITIGTIRDFKKLK